MKEGLIARGLRLRRAGRTILDGVDLDVPPGRIVGLLGPNGAGKSTCFGALAGRLPEVGGRVVLDGRELSRLPTHRRARLGVIELPQTPSLFRALRVRENVEVVLELRTGLSRSARRARAEAALARVGLSSLAEAPVPTLSGGEGRRLELARALALPARILLLDEPFAGIDPKTKDDLGGLIRELAGSLGLGVLLADHDARTVLGIADRVVLLVRGGVVIAGEASEVTASRAARDHYLGERFTL